MGLERFDCVVVGLGPAGSTALRDLAQAGVRALGIDRAIFPRPKPCGGALSARAEEQIDVSGWEETVEAQLQTVRVALRRGREIRHTAEKVICRFVMRDQFDHLLLRAAAAAGAQVREGQALRSVELTYPGVVLDTPLGKISAECLLGCDGANSLVARSVGLPHTERGVAVEAEIEAPPDVLEQWSGQVYVSYAEPAWGYGWVFPKSNRLSAGAGSFAPRSPGLRQVLSRFLAHCGLDGYPKCVLGHPIPLGGKHRPVQTGPVLLAGDAASLCDPLSGEGISHALLSGHIAARHVVEYLDGAVTDFSQYQQEIDSTIVADLALARWIARRLYVAPGLFFRLFERSPQTLDIYFRLISGETSYREVVDHVRNEFLRLGIRKAGLLAN